MTSWLPELRSRAGPLYLAIASVLARDITAGRIEPGTRLPTHRELADRLGVTVGTVTRAYAEATRRGLVFGEVGRGTFTRGAPARTPSADSAASNLIDLSINVPPPPAGIDEGALLRTSLSALSERVDLGALLSYPSATGVLAQREAGALFLQRSALTAPADRILVSSGSQHAMTAVFSALTRPGDVVLTEQLTYQGVKALAHLLHLKLQGLPIDAHGIVPEAFAAACRKGAKLLYCVPTLHNPTTAIIPKARRKELAAIATAHGAIIVEDDVYGLFLDAPRAPITSFAPESCVYLTGASKVLAPGLRVGFLLAPRSLLPQLSTAIRTTTWMAAPLMVEIASAWIRDGVADLLISGRRSEAVARQRIAARVLKNERIASHPNASHLWLPLPAAWQSDAFSDAARRCGVTVAPRSQFLVAGGGAGPDAVRVSLGAARDHAELERGLQIVADLLKQNPSELAPGP
jgi:DNA-binding transcriptional MocR family regulator